MRFDYTNGESARYMISIHRGLVSDFCYYHYFKDAKNHYDKLMGEELTEGTSINLYDMVKDEKKAFYKF